LSAVLAGTAPKAPRTGVVADVDEPRGLGTVLGDDGRRYPFHCTAVADGSRRIEAGTRVVFTTAAGHLGRTEARGLVRAGDVAGAHAVTNVSGGGDRGGGEPDR
jgi:cold shock CspA family protein